MITNKMKNTRTILGEMELDSKFKDAIFNIVKGKETSKDYDYINLFLRLYIKTFYKNNSVLEREDRFLELLNTIYSKNFKEIINRIDKVGYDSLVATAMILDADKGKIKDLIIGYKKLDNFVPKGCSLRRYLKDTLEKEIKNTKVVKDYATKLYNAIGYQEDIGKELGIDLASDSLSLDILEFIKKTKLEDLFNLDFIL